MVVVEIIYFRPVQAFAQAFKRCKRQRRREHLCHYPVGVDEILFNEKFIILMDVRHGGDIVHDKVEAVTKDRLEHSIRWILES